MFPCEFIRTNDLIHFFCVFAFVCLFRKQGRGDIQPQLDSAMQDVSDKYILLEETEKQALRKALIEERQRFCWFVAMLQPVVVSTAGAEGEKQTSDKHSESNRKGSVESSHSAAAFCSHKPRISHVRPSASSRYL